MKVRFISSIGLALLVGANTSAQIDVGILPAKVTPIATTINAASGVAQPSNMFDLKAVKLDGLKVLHVNLAEQGAAEGDVLVVQSAHYDLESHEVKLVVSKFSDKRIAELRTPGAAAMGLPLKRIGKSPWTMAVYNPAGEKLAAFLVEESK